jgi:hypothetical protein
MVPLLRLPRRESWWMDAEILMLRHQLLAIPVRAAAGPIRGRLQGDGLT